ncbi:hypothetical protein LCGC14_1173250 [marine sediment metagenome]|uniref:Uncharacterized protein n=1 Tax=marine sediment metagenome TaxID=412755 RepID=A0A0F9P799_9ZZZZ
MKHRILTCKNHPELRWSCKEIAWTEGVGFNNNRSLFFKGIPSGEGMFDDGSGLDCIQVKDEKLVEECACSARELILAPEDKLVTK